MTYHDMSRMLRAVAGMALVAGFYLVLYVAVPGQLGGGDVKLGGILGLSLGWAGWSVLLTGTLLGWLLAAITHLVPARNGGAAHRRLNLTNTSRARAGS